MLPGISSEAFFAEYWQKKPLLIRNFDISLCQSLSAEELAGLACENDVESRLVYEKNDQWQLEHGPFSEPHFLGLPDKGWCLLVQGCNHHVPDVNQLLSRFDFLPQWRCDDIMASYTPGNGSTAPHFDYYDVFILQAQGSRQWHIGQHCDSTSALRQDTDLAILENFNKQQSFELLAGDLLYIPQQIAHWGTGDDPSLSYSIGFRGPDLSELFDQLCHQLIDNNRPEQRLQENDTPLKNNPGEFSASTESVIRKLLQEQINNADITGIFGRHFTAPRHGLSLHDPQQCPNIDPILDGSEYTILRDEQSRLLYSDINGQFRFFINGEEMPLPDKNCQAIAKLLCNHYKLTADDLKPYLVNESQVKFLYHILQEQCFYLDES